MLIYLYMRCVVFNSLIQSYEFPYLWQRIYVCPLEKMNVFEILLKNFCENIWRFRRKCLPLHSLLRSSPNKTMEIETQGERKFRKIK